MRIRLSKTDQQAAGVSVPVLWGSFPRIDPIAVATHWREAVAVAPGDAAGHRGALLRAVDRHGHLGRRLHPKSINDIVI